MPEFFELDGQQRRQVVDAENLYKHLRHTASEAQSFKGSMFWREQSGRRYLIKLLPTSEQRSLGPDSEETQRTFKAFMSRKQIVESRFTDLREQAVTMKRLNRALRVGRTPDTLIDVLNKLKSIGVAEHFLVVGTNSMFAYETAGGIRFPSDAMETRDAGLLYDTRKRVAFLQIMADRNLSLLDILQRVDKTFERHPTKNFTAVNSKGYEIDLIRRFPPKSLESTEHPLQMTANDDDLWAVPASTGERLLSVARFDQVVVGLSGEMALMRTVHPMAFARIKRQLAADPKRDPLKAPKDLLQAELVEKMVPLYLPHLALEPDAAVEAPREEPPAAQLALSAAEPVKPKRGRPRKTSAT